MAKLSEILERFNNRRAYQELDTRALDISRKAAAGDWGEADYADWALISNDPIVMANIVKTFITVLVSKLSSSPFRPEDDKLNELGIALKLNSLFSKIYQDVLQDGYAYLSLGIEDGNPVIVPVDARYVSFIGDEPTLADAQDVLVFEIIGKTLDDEEKEFRLNHIQMTGYVKYNEQTERVIVKHYSKREGIVYLDIYEKDDELDVKQHYTLDGLTRIPVVRFVGDEVELSDERTHYRGLYHLTASVLKAMVLAATKLNIQAAAFDNDNYIVQHEAIKNHMMTWQNTGLKTYDAKDANGQDIQPPTPIQHDSQFLITSFTTWKAVLSDMLGPVVQSSSEAITREEVLARNEVRDAITNNYLNKMVNSIGQVYMLITQFMSGMPQPEPKIIGGFIESSRRNLQKQELMQIYNLAKESGLNTQGFTLEFLRIGDLDMDMKARLATTFQQDPYKSPLTQQLQQTIEQSKKALEMKDQQIAILKTQATQRLERQTEWTNMQERIRTMDSARKERTDRLDIAFKQWKEENANAQQARIEFMKSLLEKGDIPGAIQALRTMEARDPLLLAQSLIDDESMQNDKLNMVMSQNITQPMEGLADGNAT